MAYSLCDAKDDVEFSVVLQDAENNLQSAVQKAAEKQRAKLIAVNSSSDSSESKKSNAFGSSTLSNLSTFGIGIDSLNAAEDGVFQGSKESSVIQIEDMETPSFVDTSEELLCLSSDSSAILSISKSSSKKSFREEFNLHKKLEDGASNTSFKVNNAINLTEINGSFLSKEANHIIDEIEKKMNLQFFSPSRRLTILDLEKYTDLNGESPFLVNVVKEKQGSHQIYDEKLTSEKNNEGGYHSSSSLSLHEEFFLVEAQKVLEMLERERNIPDLLENRFSILDLENINDCLISSPVKGQGFGSNPTDHKAPQISTPKSAKWERENLFQKIGFLLRVTDSAAKNVEIQSPYEYNASLRTSQHTVSNLHSENADTKNPGQVRLAEAFDEKTKPMVLVEKNLNDTFNVGGCGHSEAAEKAFSVAPSIANTTISINNPLAIRKDANDLNLTYNTSIMNNKLTVKEILNAVYNDREKDIKNVTFVNQEHENCNLTYNAVKERENTITDSDDADNKENFNRTFEIVGNGIFRVEGKETNLIDMESDDLRTVLQNTPVSSENQVSIHHKRRSLQHEKKKQSFLKRLSLAGDASPVACSNVNSSDVGCNDRKEAENNNAETNIQLASSKNSNLFMKQPDILSRDEVRIKLRKNNRVFSGSQGPVKAVLNAEQQQQKLKQRAASTPLAGRKASGERLNSVESCASEEDGNKAKKLPSLSSFSSVSSIDERPNTFEVVSDGSVGTPEIFRHRTRDEPARTSTPAMNIKGIFSKILDGLFENNIPTPIIAPKDVRRLQKTISSGPNSQSSLGNGSYQFSSKCQNSEAERTDSFPLDKPGNIRHNEKLEKAVYIPFDVTDDNIGCGEAVSILPENRDCNNMNRTGTVGKEVLLPVILPKRLARATLLTQDNTDKALKATEEETKLLTCTEAQNSNIKVFEEGIAVLSDETVTAMTDADTVLSACENAVSSSNLRASEMIKEQETKTINQLMPGMCKDVNIDNSQYFTTKEQTFVQIVASDTTEEQKEVKVYETQTYNGIEKLHNTYADKKALTSDTATEQEIKAVGSVTEQGAKHSGDKTEQEVNAIDDLAQLEVKALNDVAQLNSNTFDASSKQEVTTPDELAQLEVKLSDDLAQLEGKALNYTAQLEVKASDDFCQLNVKVSDYLYQLEVRTSDDIVQLEMKASDDLSQPEVRTSDDIVQLEMKASDDLSQLEVRTSDDIVQLEMKASDDLSQPEARTSDDIVQQEMKASDDLSQLEVRTSDDIVQLEIKASDDLSQPEARTLDDIVQLEMKASDDLSQLEVRTSDDIVQLEMKASDDLSQPEARTSDDIVQLEMKASDDLAQPEVKAVCELPEESDTRIQQKGSVTNSNSREKNVDRFSGKQYEIIGSLQTVNNSNIGNDLDKTFIGGSAIGNSCGHLETIQRLVISVHQPQTSVNETYTETPETHKENCIKHPATGAALHGSFVTSLEHTGTFGEQTVILATADRNLDTSVEQPVTKGASSCHLETIIEHTATGEVARCLSETFIAQTVQEPATDVCPSKITAETAAFGVTSADETGDYKECKASNARNMKGGNQRNFQTVNKYSRRMSGSSLVRNERHLFGTGKIMNALVAEKQKSNSNLSGINKPNVPGIKALSGTRKSSINVNVPENKNPQNIIIKRNASLNIPTKINSSLSIPVTRNPSLNVAAKRSSTPILPKTSNISNVTRSDVNTVTHRRSSIKLPNVTGAVLKPSNLSGGSLKQNMTKRFKTSLAPVVRSGKENYSKNSIIATQLKIPRSGSKPCTEVASNSSVGNNVATVCDGKSSVEKVSKSSCSQVVEDLTINNPGKGSNTEPVPDCQSSIQKSVCKTQSTTSKKLDQIPNKRSITALKETDRKSKLQPLYSSKLRYSSVRTSSSIPVPRLSNSKS